MVYFAPMCMHRGVTDVGDKEDVIGLLCND